jgi:Icc protein
MPTQILLAHNHDGIDRRGFLRGMARAGTGALCVLEGGVLKSYGLDDPAHIAKAARCELSFVPISDSPMGFNKPANSDVTATLKAAVAKISALPVPPEFILHTRDISHLSKPAVGGSVNPFDLKAALLAKHAQHVVLVTFRSRFF